MDKKITLIFWLFTQMPTAAGTVLGPGNVPAVPILIWVTQVLGQLPAASQERHSQEAGVVNQSWELKPRCCFSLRYLNHLGKA